MGMYVDAGGILTENASSGVVSQVPSNCSLGSNYWWEETMLLIGLEINKLTWLIDLPGDPKIHPLASLVLKLQLYKPYLYYYYYYL